MARIGARKHGKFKAVSTAPSINKTPVGSSTPPLPYPVTHDLDNSVGVVPTVRLNNRPAYVLDQTTQPSCKGVKSGTVSGEVKPVKGSSTVRVGKKPIIRQGDPCTMNGGNCPGVYVTSETPSAIPAKMAAAAKPTAKPETPAEKNFLDSAAESLKQAGQWYKDSASEALHDFAGNAMDTGGTISAAGGGTTAVGGVMVATGVGAVPGAVAVAGGGAVAAVGGGVAGVGGIAESAATALDGAANFATSGQLPNLTAMATAYAQRMVMSKIDKLTKLIPGKKGKKHDDKDMKPAQGGGSDGFSVIGSGDGDCGIKPYKDQKCPEGQQAHHIVPDYALRYGTRDEAKAGKNRIPGMPSLDDGPSICLSGGSKSKGGEHNAAHEGTDPKIAAAGKKTTNGPDGLATIGEILDISIDEVSKVKPHCKDEIKKKVDGAFKDVDRNKYGRTTQQPPKPGTDANTSASSGEMHESNKNTRVMRGKKGK